MFTFWHLDTLAYIDLERPVSMNVPVIYSHRVILVRKKATTPRRPDIANDHRARDERGEERKDQNWPPVELLCVGSIRRTGVPWLPYKPFAMIFCCSFLAGGLQFHFLAGNFSIRFRGRDFALISLTLTLCGEKEEAYNACPPSFELDHEANVALLTHATNPSRTR